MRILRRLLFWLRPRRADVDLRDEVEFHRAEIQRTLEAAGMPPSDASDESRRRMGNTTLALEDARQVWIARWIDACWQDLRYAVRTFRRDWVFSLVALITLTLGIGAATAIFSVVYAVALKPLPYADSGKLFEMSGVVGARSSLLSLDQYNALVTQNRTLRQVASAKLEMSASPGGDGQQHIPDYACTPNLFDVLGVRPEIGRTFGPRDDGARVAVLAHQWWMERFGGDHAVLGRSITLDGVSYDVIGVMPADFRFPYERSADVWIPADEGSKEHTELSGVWLTVTRLQPNASLASAQTELGVVSARFAAADSRFAHRTMLIRPILEAVVGGPVQTRLFVLFGAVAFVLLIACVNVASLLLTRSHARARELAVRAAIGADRRRLIRQLLTEALLMAVAGGGAGVLFARWALHAIVALIPSSIPRTGSIAIDGVVGLVAVVLSLASGIVCGLAPAWRVSRRELHDSLKDAAPVAAPTGIARLGAVFVFAETSLTLVLLVGAGLMIHSFSLLTHVDPGFDVSHLTLITLRLRGGQPAARVRELLRRAQGLPGVHEASGADLVPFVGFTLSTNFQIQGRPSTAFDPSNTVTMQRVLPDYFRVLRIPVVRGREFTGRDSDGSPLVAVINEAAARLYVPGENPIGLRIYGEDGWYQIVGIVKDVRWKSLADDTPPAVYFPLLQSHLWNGVPVNELNLIVRTDPNAHVRLQDLRAQATEAFGGSVFDVRSMDGMMAKSIQQWKFQAVLLGMFGAVALVIALIGIFGVTSYAVVQRTREIGVRLALGAQRSQMLRLIVGSTARPVVAGLIVGLLGAALATRTLASFLFQITPTDVSTYALAATLFLAVALVAAALPAYRATLIDPIATLRHD